jgi:hypothetical protein
MAGYGLPTLNLGGLLDPIVQSLREQQQREQWGQIGDVLTSGKADYNQAAASMFRSGQPSLALKLLELGQAYRKQQLGEQAGADFSNAIGGMFGGGAAAPNPAPRAESFDPASVPSFVAAAGGRHGISPDYMTRTAWIESRGNPRARNPSGASGLFQFMPQTAAQYGLQDPFNGEASADAAARLAADNRASLRSALRREPSDAELYLAHQQGAGGASALLLNPNAPAHDVLARVYGDPNKAAAAIRQNGGNLNMTAREFAGLWTGKFDALGGGSAGVSGQPSPATRTAAMTLPPEASGGPGWFDRRVGSDVLPSTFDAASGVGGVRGGARPPGHAAAEMPASGATPVQAQFVVPGTAAAVQPDSAVLEQRAQRAVEAANKGGISTRIASLTKVLSNPHLPDSQRQVGLAFLRDAIDQAKIPDAAKEFLWARGSGLTQARTPAEYEREKKGPPTEIQEFEYGQRNPAFAARQLELKRAGAQNINVGGGSDRQIFDVMGESATSARAAATGLAALREARAAVEGGIVSGVGADFNLGLRRAAAALGADASKVVNTETFRSAIAPQIAAMMKATVGSTQISNADREFAEKAAGGSITLNEGSIRRLLDIMERANVGLIETHQKRLEAVYPASGNFGRERALFGVDAPARAPAGGGPLPVGGTRNRNGVMIERVE